MPVWKVDERQVREDVQVNLPPEWRLRVFKVVSGGTGKIYRVQWLRKKYFIRGAGTKASPVIPLQNILWCDCPEGKSKAPLTILGIDDFECNHVQHVRAVIHWET